MSANTTKDIVLNPPPAAASAEALTPGSESDAPEFILFMHDGEPVVYKRYEKGGGD